MADDNNIRVLIRYEGVVYIGFAIDKTGQAYRCGKKKWEPLTKEPRGDGYFASQVKHPVTGKRKWVMLHVAVLESFQGRPEPGLIACHGPETKRSDGALGACEWKTHKGNRADRRRDNTHSTGRAMRPGKLKEHIPELLRLFDSKTWSVRKLADRFEVSRQAITNQLQRHGRKTKHGK